MNTGMLTFLDLGSQEFKETAGIYKDYLLLIVYS